MRVCRVQGVRAVGLIVVRSVAVVLVCYGAWMVVGEAVDTLAGYVVTMAPFQRPQGSYQSLNRMGSVVTSDEFSAGVTLVLIGVPLGLLSRRVVRFVVRPPEQGCPGCGQGLGDGVERCPECGLGGVGS